LDNFDYDWIDHLFLLSNDKFASFTNENNRFRIWNAVGDSYQCLKTIEEEMNSLCVINNNLLVGCKKDIKCFNNINYKFLRSLQGHNNKVVSLLFIEKSQILVSGSNDNAIRVCDATKNFLCIQSVGNDYKVKELVYLKSEYFVTSENGVISIWDLAGFKCVKVLEDHRRKLTHLSIMKDNRIISAAKDGDIIILGY
jgi:WD40 repeat protein